jgi:hypothetical protein
MNLLALHHCFILGELAQEGQGDNRLPDLTQIWNKVLGKLRKKASSWLAWSNVVQLAGDGTENLDFGANDIAARASTGSATSSGYGEAAQWGREIDICGA